MSSDVPPPTADVPRPAAPPGAAHRIRWEDDRDRPAAPPARRRRRALGAAVALAAAVVGVALIPAGTPAPPDRFAVDQVAQRYRALGADLLAGAARCAPVAPEPGEAERVSCGFGGYAMTLTTYDTADRLGPARASARLAAPTSVRSAVAEAPGSIFVLDEISAGSSRIYWDAETPRPTSAAVSTSKLSMPQLLAFFDHRGFALVHRPDLPGPAFSSGALWFSVGWHFADLPGATCGPPTESRWRAAAEAVQCALPNGTTAYFVLPGSAKLLASYRLNLATDSGTVPGTHTAALWNQVGSSPKTNLYVEYVKESDHKTYLYFEDPAVPCFGLLVHPSLPPTQLRDFWNATVTGFGQI